MAFIHIMIIQSFGENFHQSYISIVRVWMCITWYQMEAKGRAHRSEKKVHPAWIYWCNGLFEHFQVKSALRERFKRVELVFTRVASDIYVNISDICIHSIEYWIREDELHWCAFFLSLSSFLSFRPYFGMAAFISVAGAQRSFFVCFQSRKFVPETKIEPNNSSNNKTFCFLNIYIYWSVKIET